MVRISNEKGPASWDAGYAAGYGGNDDMLMKRESKAKVAQIEPGIIKILNTSYLTYEIE